MVNKNIFPESFQCTEIFNYIPYFTYPPKKITFQLNMKKKYNFFSINSSF